MAGHFGIDFGTTNSAVVWKDVRRGYRTIGDYDNMPFPSMVAINKLTQDVSCGREVKRRTLELLKGQQELVFQSVKSQLDDDRIWSYGGREWNAELIAAELFSALSDRAKEVTGEPITQAVVAIPVGMKSEKRAVLRRAAQLAGIEVLSLISEPTAAFASLRDELRHCRYVAVFDWGGGTLDIVILEMRSGQITERSVSGLLKAGDYIDHRFAEWLHQCIAEQRGLGQTFESIAPKDQQGLINVVEDCKIKLQTRRDTVAQLGSYAGHLVSLTVTQDDFNAIVKPIVTEAVDRLFDCVADAKISPEEIGKLVLVGGSSNLRALDDELHRRWPTPNFLKPDGAEWAIAKGAAMLAANPGCYRLADDIGLTLADDSYHSIFPAGTDLNKAHSTLHFGLVEDSQTATFIFASQPEDGQPAYIGNWHTPAFGFRDEIIELDSRITSDLVFEAKARSKWRDQHNGTPFIYEKLRWRYEMPNGTP
jgi:molecular chaperone DnaK